MQSAQLPRVWKFVLSWGLILVLWLSAFDFAQLDVRAQDVAPAPSEAALRTLVENYFAAYGKKDLAKVMELWSDQSPNLPAYKQSLQRQFTSEDLSFGSPALSRVIVENEKAHLRVTIVLQSINLKSRRQSEQRQAYILEFLNERGEWKVWRCALAAEDLAEQLVKAESKAAQEKLLTEEKELAPAGLGRALLTQGWRLFNKGSYTRAKGIIELALEVTERSGDKSAIARALLDNGLVHDIQGNYAQALELYQKSLEISEEAGDKFGMGDALNNIAIINQRQGDYAQALEQHRKSLKIKEEIGDKSGIAMTLVNVGIVHWLQGDYAQALEQIQKGLRIFEEIGNKVRVAHALISTGAVYNDQGNPEQALEQYQKGLKIYEEIGDNTGIASALNNIGSVHGELGDYAQALEQYRKSLKIKEEIGNKTSIALTLNNIGEVYGSQGKYAEALEQCQKSLGIREEVGDKSGMATVLLNIGELHRLQGNHTQALQFAERAAGLATEIGLTETLREARANAGKAHFALKQFGQARVSFDQAISTIENLRANVAGGEREQQRFFESKVSPYYAMVELLIAQNQPGEALSYAERAKARVLINVLTSGRVSVTKAMTSQEQEQERKFNHQLESLNSQVYREKLSPQPDQARLAQLEAQLEQSRLDLEAFQINLYAAHPELRTRRGETSSLRIEQVDALLPSAGDALLEFVVADEKTYLFAITKSGAVKVQVYPLEIKQQDLTDQVKSFRRMLSTSDNGFSRSAHDLYNLLLKPAAAQLRGKTRLLIVPDGPLWELPFQALQTPQGRYLIDDHAISYAPSLTVLREMIHSRRSQASKPNTAPSLLALGNPALDSQHMPLVNAALMDERFNPLPEAERQVRTLGRIYGPHKGKIYVGSEASEDRFKSEAKDFRILHLATHGILNNRNPMYSHLLLAQTGEMSGEDGLLEARELMKLELNADLVVLSACETARGQVSRGEGMIGMTWALFVAGAPTTVVSQWKVRSDSTAELMVEFHRRLQYRANGSARRNSVAEALREASLKVKRDSRYRHPFDWASFIVVGDGY